MRDVFILVNVMIIYLKIFGYLLEMDTGCSLSLMEWDLEFRI
jgi:hypothetical protein